GGAALRIYTGSRTLVGPEQLAVAAGNGGCPLGSSRAPDLLSAAGPSGGSHVSDARRKRLDRVRVEERRAAENRNRTRLSRAGTEEPASLALSRDRISLGHRPV